MSEAEEKLARIQAAFQHSSLPEQPDRVQVNEVLADISEEWQDIQ